MPTIAVIDGVYTHCTCLEARQCIYNLTLASISLGSPPRLELATARYRVMRPQELHWAVVLSSLWPVIYGWQVAADLVRALVPNTGCVPGFRGSACCCRPRRKFRIPRDAIGHHPWCGFQ